MFPSRNLMSPKHLVSLGLICVALLVSGVPEAEPAPALAGEPGQLLTEWSDACRALPSSQLRARAQEIRSRLLGLSARTDLDARARYELVLGSDGMVTRELARRRRLFNTSSREVAALEQIVDAQAHHVTLSPRQRISGHRNTDFRVEIPAYPELNYRDEVTYSLWLFLDTRVSVDETKVVSHAGVGAGKLALTLDRENQLRIVLQLEGPEEESSSVLRWGWRRPVAVGKWIHVAAAFRYESGPTLYLSGEHVEESFITRPGKPGARIRSLEDQTLYLGGLDRNLPGALDDVRVYDRALEPGEIAALAAGEDVAGGLVGHWPLDEIRGVRAGNAVPWGNAGEIGRGVLIDQEGAAALKGGRAFRFARSPEQWRRDALALQSAIDTLERRLLGNVEAAPAKAPSINLLLRHLRDRGVVLIHYLENPTYDRLQAFVLDPGRVAPIVVVDLGPATEIRRKVRRVQEAARLRSTPASADEERYRSAARHLAAAIWDPLSDRLERSGEIWLRLDGGLNGVAFAALTDSMNTYLVERYAFARTGPVVRLMRPHDTVLAAPVIAFGNPAFRHHPDEAESTPPAGPVTRGPGTNDCLVRSRALHGTHLELTRLAELFRRKSARDVRIYEGRAAYETRLEEVAGESGVLHIATHGYRLTPGCLPETPWNPLVLSGLELAGKDRARSEDSRRVDDGYLSADELSRYRLEGVELVVLSGCSTALGPAWPGEGTLGLPSGAWIAGAGATLATLWDVEDETMALDMLAFYEAWLDDVSLAGALQLTLGRAMARTKRERGHTHPAYWAALVIEGL